MSAHSSGLALVRSMRACVRWPAWLDPLKAAWLLLGMALLKRGFMRGFAPEIRADAGFSLAGSPVHSMLNRIVLYRGVFEPSLSRAVTELVREGAVCLDLGANVGYFSLLLASRCGASGRVLAVEASPGNLGKLRANLRLNGYEDCVQVVDAACTDQSGPVTFYVSRKNDMHCRLALPQKGEADYWLMRPGSWRPVVVQARTLPDILGELAAQVSFVKLDIEGAEHRVVAALLAHCTHAGLVVALEAKAPHIGATLRPFEAAGFFAYDLHNDYRWLLNTRVPRPTRVSFESLCARRGMVDVLLSRRELDFTA